MKAEFSRFIAVECKDFENAVRFYQNMLGMELKNKSDTEAELHLGDRVFFIENSDKGRTFLEFNVEDIEKAKEAFVAAGCEAFATKSPEGTVSYKIHDPFGMKFHLWNLA